MDIFWNCTIAFGAINIAMQGGKSGTDSDVQVSGGSLIQSLRKEGGPASKY